VLLAFMGDEAIEHVLRGDLVQIAPHTPTDAAAIRRELAEIRANDYAISFEETDAGVAGVSVPIRDYLDRVVAGLSISGPLTRVNRDTIGRFVDIAQDGARRISAALGHKPPVVAPTAEDAAAGE
jgi:DNA-binding IclR family transcriptional regulator